MFLLVLIFNFFPISSTLVDISYLRTLYSLGANSEAKAELLISKTENNTNSIMMGYNGAGKILMAKHYYNPISKLSSFNEGKEILEKAIQGDLYNPELRYLRLTIQTNVPSFLGYSSNINEDKLYLTKKIKIYK